MVSKEKAALGRRRRTQALVGCAQRCAAVTGLLLCMLSGCTSFGSIGVDPDRGFSGLRDIVANVDDGGTVDIFLVHGMRVDAPDQYADVIAAVVKRLGLKEVGTDPPIKLVPVPPTVSLDGVTVFQRPEDWDVVRPVLTIQRFQTKVGDRRVNFYRFEYWQALAMMKCRFIVAPDTRVLGESNRSDYCRQAPWNAEGGSRLSSAPDYLNKELKTEIMEWGLADATIATSSYRTVLRQAVREMFAHALNEERTGAGLSSDAGMAATEEFELQRVKASRRIRFAFISESLGSYVIHDALEQSRVKTPSAIAERAALQPDVRARRLEAMAPTVVICGASQVHMFANQLALLRFSELQVRETDAVLSSAAGSSTGQSADNIPGRSHFFRGCPPSMNSAAAVSAGAFSAQQVVAYHEPNDVLTYYTSDRPGDVGAANHNTTNVVVPYASQWVWFLVANPIEAHTGQPQQKAIMDMVVCGRSIGKKTSCRP